VSAENPDYSNRGFAVVGNPPPDLPDAAKTLIVLGAPRGGTSAIAGALNELGIFMGGNAIPPVFEDLELASRMERGAPGDARVQIEKYNAEHHIWGYKRPGLAFSIKENHSLFRNPVYLVIFRDVFATANRNLISSHLKNDLRSKMARVQLSYTHILEFLSEQSPYSLLCSYEKLLQAPDAYIDFLLENAGLEVSAAQRAAAVNFITPQPEAYLDHARADRCHGALDRIEGDTVCGWARFRSRFVKRPAEVQLFLDDQLAGNCMADQPLYPGCSFLEDPAESCAFRFRLPPNTSADSVSVRVKVSHEREDLDNSPLVQQPAAEDSGQKPAHASQGKSAPGSFWQKWRRKQR
jgi:hypothetical protein